MNKSLLLLLVVVTTLLLALPAHSAPAGVAAAIDSVLVTNIKNYITPAIIRSMNNLNLEKIEFHDGYVEDIKLDLKIQDDKSIELELSQLVNGVILKCRDIQGVITGAFKYKPSIFLPTVKGKFKVTFEQGAVQLGVDMPLARQNVNDRMLPQLKVEDFLLSINASKIKISLSGSLLVDIADKLVWIFKSSVIKAIQNAVNKDVPSTIYNLFNDFILKTNGYLPIYKDLAMDYSFPSDPVVTDSVLGLYLNATMFNTSVGYKTPFAAISDIPLDLQTKNSILVDTSSYAADSLLIVLQDSGIFNRYISHQTVPEQFAFLLNTTYLEALLPGIEEKYGANVAVDIAVSTKYAPNTFFKQDKMGANATAVLEFIIPGVETAAILELKTTSFVSVVLHDFLIKLAVKSISIDNVSVPMSNVGHISTTALKIFLNTGIKIATPMINEFLSAGFKLPNTFFDMVKIDAAEFTSKDNFVLIQFTPQFI